jgi:hypothetical protein
MAGQMKRDVLGIFFGFILAIIFSREMFTFQTFSFSRAVNLTASHEKHSQPKERRCALLFFGLPRSYEQLVLPSLVKNVLLPNIQCDVYAHTIMRTEEPSGRSGKGGSIDPNALFLLEKRVHELHNKSSSPNVVISTETEEEFWRVRNATIDMYRTKKGADGKLLYYPWNKTSFDENTVNNVVKQWHSIEAVWMLMEREAETLQLQYDLIGMFRSDVFFATPIDITGNMTSASHISEAIYPGFALHPVNDRMFFGQYHAVRIWASERFRRVVSDVHRIRPGSGIHPENFLNDVLFPAIRENGHKVKADPNICFFRVRADMSTWISDCLQARQGFEMKNLNRSEYFEEQKRLVESIVGCPCESSNLNAVTKQLVCRPRP